MTKSGVGRTLIDQSYADGYRDGLEAVLTKRDEMPTVERLAEAINEASIHLAHGDPEEQARRIINVLQGREWWEDES